MSCTCDSWGPVAPQHGPRTPQTMKWLKGNGINYMCVYISSLIPHPICVFVLYSVSKVVSKSHLFPLFFFLCSGAINLIDTMSRRRWAAAGVCSPAVVWGPTGGPLERGLILFAGAEAVITRFLKLLLSLSAILDQYWQIFAPSQNVWQLILLGFFLVFTRFCSETWFQTIEICGWIT